READWADVGEQLELEPEELFLARLAGLDLARSPVGRGREPRVAESAAAAFRDEHAVALVRQIAEQPQRLVLVGSFVDERADRHRQLEVGAILPGAVRPLAVLAALGVELRMETV